MELQLGLALPGINPVKEFDLNNNFVFDPQDHHLITKQSSLNPYCFLLPTHTASTTTTFEDVNTKKKRSFCQAFLDHNETVAPPTLPLLVWNNHPNDDEDDHPKDLHNNSSHSSINIKEEGNGDGVVGWPPVKPWRKKRVWSHGFINNGSGSTMVENGCGCGGRVSNSMYVKVKMDGVAIARKVDLSIHHSFQTLLHTLMNMFAKCQEDSENYKLTYQDREGDWLFADQDVPWRTFTRSVQRLKLVKKSH